MKRNPTFVFQVVLAVVDVLIIIAAFSLAYYYRLHFDPRPFEEGSTLEFILSIIFLMPVWVILFVVCGLYDRSIYTKRSKSYGRLLIAAAIGTMSMISYEFFVETDVLPGRLVAIYAFVLSFVMLVIGREIMMLIRKTILKHGQGLTNVLIVGNDNSSYILANNLDENAESGYRVCGIIANNEFVPENIKERKYTSLATAITESKPDVIVQTENTDSDRIYTEAINHHLSYMFVPDQELLISHSGEMDIIGFQPVIHVRVTPLVGGARLVKRLCDILFGGIFLIIASPFLLIIAIIIKINEPKGNVFYKEKRYTRFGRKRNIYKFRSMKTEFCNMTPEQAFEKMNRPELSIQYRANGDQLDDDPRITKIGKFLRSFSLDELPQLINVVRGDISLVGPRALQPQELKEYKNKNLILSIKSGLTGLAQVSGRREIGFEERRLLDIYYIQNWSLLLDIQIIFRTIATVILRRGAK